MFRFVGNIFPLRKQLDRLTRPSAALLTLVGLVVGGWSAMATTARSWHPFGAIALANSASETASESEGRFFPNGVYLYGEVPEADRLGKAYLVFEVRQNRAIGAFYMPRSSFDCFYGDVRSHQFALTVINSYDRTAHDYAIGLRDNPVAATGANPPVSTGLRGFHRLATLSETDRRILEVCKQDHQERVW